MSESTNNTLKTYNALAEALIGGMLAMPDKWISIISDAIRRDVVWPAQYRSIAALIPDLHRQKKLTPELLASDTGADIELLLNLKVGFTAEYDAGMDENVSRMIALGKTYAERAIASRLHKGELTRQEAAEELLALDAIGSAIRATDSAATAEEFLSSEGNVSIIQNPIGIPPLDMTAESFGDHESTAILGRYGSQKSRQLRNWILAMAARGSRPVLFCAEGYRRPTTAAFIAMIADSLMRARGQWDHEDNHYKLKAHNLIRPPYYWKGRPIQSAAVYDAVKLWEELGIRILDANDGADDADAILSEAIRRTQGDTPATIVAIDYMQKVKVYEHNFKGQRRLVDSAYERSVHHQQLISDLRKTGAHVLLAGQMNENANQGNQGNSSGYKGGGDVPQEADNVLNIIYHKGIDEWVEMESTKMRNSGYMSIKTHVIKDSGLIIGYEDMNGNEVPVDIIPRDKLVTPMTQEDLL